MLIKEIAIINPKKSNKHGNSINYIDTSSVLDGRLLNVQLLTSNLPSRAQREVLMNDILISSVRPNLNHNYYVNCNYENLIASTGFIQVRIFNKNYLPRFVYYFLTNNNNVNLYTSIADTSQTTFPSFNKNIIENLKIPNYNITKQQHIVDII